MVQRWKKTARSSSIDDAWPLNSRAYLTPTRFPVLPARMRPPASTDLRGELNEGTLDAFGLAAVGDG